MNAGERAELRQQTSELLAIAAQLDVAVGQLYRRLDRAGAAHLAVQADVAQSYAASVGKALNTVDNWLAEDGAS